MKSIHLFRGAAFALAGALSLLLAGASFAQTPPSPTTSVKVELGGSSPVSRSLSLPRGKSAIVDLPVDARDVLVSNPAVADAVLRTPRRIYVLGNAPGQTDAVFFDEMGREILSLDIRVDQSTGALQDTLKRIVPDADIHVEPVNDSLVLTGSVASADDADKVRRIAERFVAKPEQVINMLSVRGADQVMVKVRVVEIQRTMIKQLGFNTSALLNQVGMPQYLFNSTPTYGVNGSLLGGITGGYQFNSQQQPVLGVPCAPGLSGSCFRVTRGVTAAAPNGNTATIMNTAGSTGLNQATGMLQAFERAGLARTLAEPNLSAVSGESAKFLAGGEFPVPTGLDQNGNVVVQFKQFGVALAFTPVVLSQGRISLKVATEVSELTNNGALKFSTNLTIPALDVRRAETTVEMPSGSAMMIAGLLKEQTQQNIDGVPGMTELPVLGALFRSRDYLAGETELVIIVEPYIVKPTSPDKLQTPVDGLEMASDMDTILFGKLNKTYGPGKGPAPRGSGDAAATSGPAPTWQGPVGYVIE
ncbi:MAG TPA: type II and III secretion system protein family protein [Caulobacteraceae bacterium]|jgi:pilus assembly protein CpaC